MNAISAEGVSGFKNRRKGENSILATMTRTVGDLTAQRWRDVISHAQKGYAPWPGRGSEGVRAAHTRPVRTLHPASDPRPSPYEPTPTPAAAWPRRGESSLTHPEKSPAQ